MNIILLSGGSGKRLWPLSTDIRAKQFVKMLKTDDGCYESMLQRIYRQIKLIDCNANIVIATGEQQVPLILEQLGDDVKICVEPSRRDTFPAIALASLFMIEKGVSVDDSVVVCPVDSFVQSDYFLSIKKLYDLSQNNGFNLNLMGVNPTYPSEKYGYIIPECKSQISKVSQFKEKPTKEVAENYISLGAMWNCGVFAFKLSYIQDKIKKVLDVNNYESLLSQYDELNKISFDYAVVEKEDNISVLRYDGEWVDIGTWNTFCEHVTDSVIGKGVLSDTCENTNIINELNIPVLCLGCKDMVISVSSEGILVSEKQQSSYMKPLVDDIEKDKCSCFSKCGYSTILDVQQNSAVVKITLIKNDKIPSHKHSFRDDIWHISSGEGLLTVDGKTSIVKKGDVVVIKKGVQHSLTALTMLTIIEIQSGEEINDNDIIDCDKG